MAVGVVVEIGHPCFVTLVIGLIANLFTAVFVSRTIFDFELSRKRQVTALSI
jgi:preprotein translocase subunit SecD